MKVAKDTVNYRQARPGAPRRCGTCSMFRPGPVPAAGIGGCTLVAGLIRSKDTCDQWEAK